MIGCVSEFARFASKTLNKIRGAVFVYFYSNEPEYVFHAGYRRDVEKKQATQQEGGGVGSLVL